MKYNFAKLLQGGGQVIKYQTPAGGISYNFDTFLDNLPSAGFTRGQTAGSIAWTPNWSGVSDKYANVGALEADDQYQAFTNYVLQNAESDPRVMQYLKLLEQSTTGNGHNAILFNGENLNQNWKDEYKRLRTDGKYGYYHLGPEGTTSSEVHDDSGNPGKEEHPVVPQKPSLKKREPPEPLQFKNPLPEKPEFTPWTDWIPLSTQLGNDLMSAEYQADQQKKMRFPLMETPFLQHKVTNNYHLRTSMNQNANEMRDQTAARANSSDLRQTLDAMHQADVSAAQIANQAEQIKADTVFKERGIAEGTANKNKETGAYGANFNAKQNANVWNNILDANAKRDLRRTAALNSFTGNMYTSHGEWLKDQRLNDQQYLRGLNQYTANLYHQINYQDYADLTSDYTKSQAYKNFATAVGNSSGNDIADFDSDRYNDLSRRDEYIKELWAGNSDLATQYQGMYNEEMLQAEKNYYDRFQQINNRLQAANLILPNRISNQGIYTNPRVTSTYSPLYTYAKGGSVKARFIDYQNHIQKEQQKQKELQHKRNQLVSRQLAADLDRLSREQMILLRSVFK